jgi:ribonuclease-3
MPSTTSCRDSDAGSGIRRPPERDLGPLVERLGYRPNSSDALGAALAHRSWCAENPGNASNERLEFLGDAVLGLAVTDMVFARFPEMDEGGLTDLRKSVVNAVTLAEVADEISLGDWLLLGKGEEQSGGRRKPSILSDALEAVIGAVYVDGGITPAVELIERLLSGRVDAVAETGGAGHDHKSRLQELVAQRRSSVPDYAADATGPDHSRTFTVTVNIDGEPLGEGVGRSKKQAEQRAAQAALVALDRDLPPIEPPPEAIEASPQAIEASPQEGTPGA